MNSQQESYVLEQTDCVLQRWAYFLLLITLLELCPSSTEDCSHFVPSPKIWADLYDCLCTMADVNSVTSEVGHRKARHFHLALPGCSLLEPRLHVVRKPKQPTKSLPLHRPRGAMASLSSQPTATPANRWFRVNHLGSPRLSGRRHCRKQSQGVPPSPAQIANP